MEKVIPDNTHENGIVSAALAGAEIKRNKDDGVADFKPVGAIAFFVLLLVLCSAIWFGIYYISLTRQ